MPPTVTIERLAFGGEGLDHATVEDEAAFEVPGLAVAHPAELRRAHLHRSARIEVEGKDEYFFSNSHSAKSESYELINASIFRHITLRTCAKRFTHAASVFIRR